MFAHPQNVAFGYHVGKISTGCLLSSFKIISAFVDVRLKQLCLELFQNHFRGLFQLVNISLLRSPTAITTSTNIRLLHDVFSMRHISILIALSVLLYYSLFRVLLYFLLLYHLVHCIFPAVTVFSVCAP